MIDYLKDKSFMLMTIFFITLALLFNNMQLLHSSFSQYLGHTKQIEPSMLQIRMSQYKKILKVNGHSYEFYKYYLGKLLKK